MKTASFNAFTSSPMATQHPLAKNQKALGQSQREGLRILRRLSPTEVGEIALALKPTSLGDTVRVRPQQGNTFTDAEKEDSSFYRGILRSIKESKEILRHLSAVLKPDGLDIGIVVNPNRSLRPQFEMLIVPTRRKEGKFVIPLPGIKDASQVATKFNRPEMTATSIIDELRRVFPEKALKIILEGLTEQRNPLDVIISDLSSK
jgi:hypothetical protein